MKTKLKEGETICPKCGSDWDGGSIIDAFIEQRNQGSKHWGGKTDEEIEKEVKENYSPPYRWGRQIGIQLPFDHPLHYDGISYWQCPDCSTAFNRFTGDEEALNF